MVMVAPTIVNRMAEPTFSTLGGEIDTGSAVTIPPYDFLISAGYRPIRTAEASGVTGSSKAHWFDMNGLALRGKVGDWVWVKNDIKLTIQPPLIDLTQQGAIMRYKSQ